jgi:hypothetical protein
VHRPPALVMTSKEHLHSVNNPSPGVETDV